MAKPLDNKVVKDYLNSLDTIYNFSTYEQDIPRSIDDRIAGSLSCLPNTSRPSPFSVFIKLRLLDEICYDSVSELMNRKRMAIEGVGYSKRYIQYWVKTLRWASGSIEHYVLSKEL